MVGVWLIDCEGVEVLGNRISRVCQDRIRLGSEDSPPCSRILVEGNRLLNCNLQNIWNAYSGISLRPGPRAVTGRGNTIANDDQELRIWYEGPTQAATVRYDGQTLLLKQKGAGVKEIAISALAADRAALLGQAIKKVAGGQAELTGPRFGDDTLFERRGGQTGTDRVAELPCKGAAQPAVLTAKRLLHGIQIGAGGKDIVIEQNRITG